MKKFLLTSTSILAVAFASQAFAAGSSSVYQSQTGFNQQSAIDQSNGDHAKVGTETNPFTQQNGAAPGGGSNVISIIQSGSYNSTQGSGGLYPQGANVPANNGIAGQSGTNNKGAITQSGTNGTVTFGQQGSSNGQGTLSGLDADVINQGNGNLQTVNLINMGDSNRFNIQQDGGGTSGEYNNVTLQQSSSNNTALISQSGAGLKVTSYQYGTGDNHLTSAQTGAGNSLNTTQTNTGGSSNQIFNTQTGTQSWPVLGSVVNATQNGSALTITTSQSGTTQLLDVVLQSNWNNSISNDQSGSNNTATVSYQNGTNGIINNTQSGSNGIAKYAQTGSGNVATLQNQYGTYNSVDVTQTGTNSTAQLLQYGNAGAANRNTVTLQQNVGDTNRAYLVQGGYYTGTGAGTQLYTNAAVAGNTINVTQDSFAGQSGNNYAAVQQQSNSNTSSFSQSGSSNSATVKQ